jgi:hypothetical protein
MCRSRILRPGFLAFLMFAVSGAAFAADAGPQPVPLTNVHAHNDYEHPHPLFDALACGFCSVEADINLVDGKLLVAHSRSAVKPDRTLQSLYLDPLRKRVRENGGRVYRDGPPVWLLIDFKSDPKEMYPVLRDVLVQYADILTVWRDGAKHQGAVTAILTGDHPAVEVVAAEKLRYACIDGTLKELRSNPPADLVPWMSSQWLRSFTWSGTGDMPDADRQELRRIVKESHKQGRLVRFWGAPDNVVTWRDLRAEGVDLINTDDLQGAQKFLLSQPPQPGEKH